MKVKNKDKKKKDKSSTVKTRYKQFRAFITPIIVPIICIAVVVSSFIYLVQNHVSNRVVASFENRYKIGYGDNKKAYDILASRLAKLINIDKPTFIFIDKSKNKQEEIDNFNEFFLNNLNNIKKQPITIEHADSMHYKGLQMADLISWSTFQNFENDNPEFLDIIKNKVVKLVYEN